MGILLFFLMLYGVPLLIYLICVIPALRELKARGLDETTRAVWALAIVAIPIMGALAFWILEPGQSRGS